jgi:hypothetical protein
MVVFTTIEISIITLLTVSGVVFKAPLTHGIVTIINSIGITCEIVIAQVAPMSIITSATLTP